MMKWYVEWYGVEYVECRWIIWWNDMLNDMMLNMLNVHEWYDEMMWGVICNAAKTFPLAHFFKKVSGKTQRPDKRKYTKKKKRKKKRRASVWIVSSWYCESGPNIYQELISEQKKKIFIRRKESLWKIRKNWKCFENTSLKKEREKVIVSWDYKESVRKQDLIGIACEVLISYGLVWLVQAREIAWVG